MRHVPRVTCLGLVLALLAVAVARAQTPASALPAPSFEVASVKPADPNRSGPLAQVPFVMPTPGGRFTATNVPLRLLVRMAYGVQDFQIDGGPSWQMSQRFDITAKAEDGTPTGGEALLPMIRTLLADRFRLKVHRETRDLPLYTLVMARDDGRLGRTLRPSKDDCSNAAAEQQKLVDALARGGPAALTGLLPKPGETRPCMMMPLLGGDGFGLKASGQPMSVVVQLLTQVTGRTVLDKTGLTGLYDWEMKFDPQALMQIAASQAGITLPPGVSLPTSDSPSLLTALSEELGLKLDSGRGPVEVLVIDSAELPTPD